MGHDQKTIAIMVSDRAGGISFDINDSLFSYFCGAATQGAPATSPLAGYGVGLPLSRLHARHLGGNLKVTSYPGYGTQAHLVLPRVDADQAEDLRSVRRFSGLHSHQTPFQ